MRERLIILGTVAVFSLLAVGAQSGFFARTASSLVGSAIGIEVPDLDDPAKIRRGAGHYERVCATCHASPARPDQAEVLELSPSPPKLHERADGFTPEALFHAIRHGVAGTGMPAWPVDDRDDEVWAMVAFVSRLPSMDAATYRELTGAPVADAPLPLQLADCARCHGEDGSGRADGAFPRLDIQSPQYLYAALVAFRDGRRSSGFMQSAVAGLSDAELAALADHFGQRRAAAPPGPAPQPAGGSRLPACTACHGTTAPARPDFPALAGQYHGYLAAQFAALADREHPRGGGAFVHLMHEVGKVMPDDAAAAWLAWYAGQ